MVGPWRRRRPFTGAWIKTVGLTAELAEAERRPFTGAWIETCTTPSTRSTIRVAPSQGRGLKHHQGGERGVIASRPFTGAWIETGALIEMSIEAEVAPSQGRGLKHRSGQTPAP